MIPKAFDTAVREAVRARLFGWEVFVEATNQPVPVRVSLRHPLSDGHNVLFTADQVAANDLSSMDEHLATSIEFRRIAAAPPCPHAGLVRSILTLEAAYCWSAEEVAAVGGALFDAGALTVEEYEWLRQVPPEGP